jgi:hypothetical protein
MEMFGLSVLLFTRLFSKTTELVLFQLAAERFYVTHWEFNICYFGTPGAFPRRRNDYITNFNLSSTYNDISFYNFTSVTRDEQHLRIFERKILRRIFDPLQDKDGSWRIRMNHELNELLGNADVVIFIKSRRIAWLGHLMRMDEKRITKRVLEWKPTGRRIRERPRKRWVEDTEEDIQAFGIRGWRKLSKEMTEWRRITEKAKTHSGL